MYIRHLRRDAKVGNQGAGSDHRSKGLDDIKNRADGRPEAKTQMPANLPFRSSLKWVVFTADAFDTEEEAVLVTAREFVAEAKLENPGLVLYSPVELDMMSRIRGDVARIRMVHGIKRRFGGWLKQLDVDGKTYKAAAVRRRMAGEVAV